MLCEKCKKRPAEVAIREQAADGERELYVCKSCADGSGPLERKLASMVEMLFDVAMEVSSAAATRAAAEEPRCAVCGMTREVFRKRERLGCEACYDAFGRDTEAMIRDMHQGRRHTGKAPAREQAARTREKLEKALREAVAAQRFEDAARLRDQIAQADAAAQPDGGARHAAP